MSAKSLDSLNTLRTLEVDGAAYDYFSLPAAEEAGLKGIHKLPFSLKILLENLLRHEDERTVKIEDVKAIAKWLKHRTSSHEIAYRPARVLMQDFTGVPAVVDLAVMRDAVCDLGGDPKIINPLTPVDLIIDHSVMVDRFGTSGAFQFNVEMEFKRNQERYSFLRWGQTAFDNFRVIPPGTGICHQINLEYLARVVWSAESNGRRIAYPDTLVGTDSHTTMINGLAVLGWGVGGIEAEAAMLGQPISMLIPEVIGFKLKGKLMEGATATDLVLTVVQMLRQKGVVGKFVEYFGPGLDYLTLADRATISNMGPEYGATCGIFPIDQETINYLNFTGRDAHQIALVEAYAKAQGMWREASGPDPLFTDALELDLSTVEPSLAGPKRPQDRVFLSGMPENFQKALKDAGGDPDQIKKVSADGFDMEDGAVVIASITSCTNTSNPSVMIAAGLLARNAVQKGLKTKPWVKTSLAPGSKVVTDYLKKSGLQDDLDQLGFNLVGYGCMTCIGNSGPLPDAVAKAVEENDLTVSAVLSGNRNFEGRVNPLTKANYLASPPLVVAYALAGTVRADLSADPLGTDQDGNPVYLKDIWPENEEIVQTVRDALQKEMFISEYNKAAEGGDEWKSIEVSGGMTFQWDSESTYVKKPPYFEGMSLEPAPVQDIRDARILAILGDTVTTDHISPAGSIKTDGPAGLYLQQRGIKPQDFNSFGSRRGNHEIMMRGTFANIRLRNEMAPGTTGGVTRYMPDDLMMTIYDAAMRYIEEGTPLVVVAGKEYGTGSSRDWAAKGTRLLGVRAVIAESFERIHRSNLIGMGVLPLQFKEGETRKTLRLNGAEIIDVIGLEQKIKPRMDVPIQITRPNGTVKETNLTCRLDTIDEIEYFKHGGILSYVLRSLLKK
ncbi:MAG: aconitate hydratase AcnA [Candidatus Omnitrophica bacterium]|nr:aconitate hydratase AcnA [Candidatus Omnitrophota bacterium]